MICRAEHPGAVVHGFSQREEKSNSGAPDIHNPQVYMGKQRRNLISFCNSYSFSKYLKYLRSLALDRFSLKKKKFQAEFLAGWWPLRMLKRKTNQCNPKVKKIESEKIIIMRQREVRPDGLANKGSCCSCGGLEFSSQRPQQVAYSTCNLSSWVSGALFCLCGQLHSWALHVPSKAPRYTHY